MGMASQQSVVGRGETVGRGRGGEGGGIKNEKSLSRMYLSPDLCAEIGFKKFRWKIRKSNCSIWNGAAGNRRGTTRKHTSII